MAELNVRTLSVSGMGELRVMPDIATVRLSVITRAERAADAVRQNAQLSAQVSTRVTALAGVDDQDVRTTGIRVSPVVRFDRDTGRSVIEGYEAENSIAVTVPVDMAGQIFDAGIAAGATESAGITFGLRDEEQFRLQALDRAVAQARSRAEVVARAAGVRLRAPSNIVVEGRGLPGPFVEFARAAVMDEADVPTPVFPGELSIRATVTVTYTFVA